MKCPTCGRFVKDAVATVTHMGDTISRVEAQCVKHGLVYPSDWDYEDFFPDGDSNTWWAENFAE